MRFSSMTRALAVAAAFGAVACFATSFNNVACAAPVLADEEPAAEATIDESLFDVPEDKDGAFYQERQAEIAKALDAFLKAKPADDKRDEVLAKANAAMKTIQKKIAFDQTLDQSVSYRAYQTYCSGLASEGKLDELKKLTESEKDAKDNRRFLLANLYVFEMTIDETGKNKESMKGVSDSIIEFLVQDSNVMLASYVTEFASQIEKYDADAAKELRARAVEEFGKSENAALKRVAMSIEGKERFAKLVGNEMKVEGLYFEDASEIKWEEFRGKVVLIDFWATWCGPCVREVPNVQAMYQKYHDAGFEVIGYSLDDNLDALKKFEEERKLPWKTASRKMSQESKDKEYVDLTAYYGINAIPTMVLVGKDGKVLDTNARGEHLQELLKAQFPDVKDAE